MKSANYWIEKLKLKKHPEGGWYREIYRSNDMISVHTSGYDVNDIRSSSTSIYYLLEYDDFSAFHRINSDEIWHYYAGTSAIEVLSIEGGRLKRQLCGNNPDDDEQLQVVVPKNRWFAARLQHQNGYALVGCTVSPGFDFEDFEMANEKLIEDFPQLKSEILELIRIV